MHKNFYIEHVFNQIFDEEFQEKFMEQTLQEQYEILVTIKKNLKTLCEKIQQRIELYQNHQEIFQMQQFKLEDDSDFKEYLKSIESIIHQTKQLPSTQVVLEKKKNQKKPKKKKLLDDSSFESNKSIEILYEVFRTKPIQNEAKEPLKNEPVLRRIGGSIATQNQQQIQQNVVPSIQLMNNTPQNQVSLVKQFQAEQQNIQINSSQVQDSNQTPFRRKILRNFDSQTSTPQNLKPQMELVHAESSIMNHEDNKFNPQKSMFQSPSNLMSSQVQMQNQLMYSQQQQNGGMITSQLQQQLSSQQSQQQQQQQQQQVRNLQNTQSTKTQQKRIDFQETNNKLMQEQHQPYKKMVIKDMGDEYLVFEDNLFLYEKTSDFMRDCIDSYRIMCRQKEFNKFDDYSLRKFLRYCTKVRFNISELVEQFRQQISPKFINPTQIKKEIQVYFSVKLKESILQKIQTNLFKILHFTQALKYF